MNKLLIICGPTGVGKTKIGIDLAYRYNGEIVSADSRQIYKDMDIGTGKDKVCYKSIPVWMIDIVKPDEAYSVSQYQQQAREIIKNIWARGKLPIVVGGTGLYLDAVVKTLPTASIKPDIELRNYLAHLPLTSLQDMIKRENPTIWSELNISDKNNTRRLIRKIELYKHGIEKPLVPTSFIQDVLWIGLQADNRLLYERVDKRVEERIHEGAQQEVLSLRNHGYSWNLQSMSGIGYREWKAYEEGKEKVSDVITKWKFDEHAYVRRQMTWFKKNKAIQWFSITDTSYQKKIDETVGTWYTTASYDIKN